MSPSVCSSTVRVFVASRVPANETDEWLESGPTRLSPDDRSRFDAIPSRMRRLEFLLGRALLARSSRAGHSAASVSHSLGRVAVAISGGGPVGIDLEIPRRFPEAVARRWLSDDEYRWFDSFSGRARRMAFFELFTMKEAFSKCCDVALWKAPEVPVPVSDPRCVSTSAGDVTWGRLRVSRDTTVALCVRTMSEVAIDIVRTDPREILDGG